MTQYIAGEKHPDDAGGEWIKLFHDANTTSPILTDENKRQAFIRAVTNMVGADTRWQERTKTGLNEDGLREALHYELGIAGGSGGYNSVHIAYEGIGLKIWASWKGINPYTDTPIFEGKQSIAMARLIFGPHERIEQPGLMLFLPPGRPRRLSGRRGRPPLRADMTPN